MQKQQHRVPRITTQSLARIGLVLVRRDPLVVTCATCGSEWQRQDWQGIRWLRCLKGCNASLLHPVPTAVVSE